MAVNDGCNNQKRKLQNSILVVSVINLFLLSVAGVLLRASPFIDVPFVYKHLLHGHSHFAFAGWIYPAFMWMLMKYFPVITDGIAFKKWEATVIINVVTAYAMLVCFSVQGYAALSISISTLSILNTFYFTSLIWKQIPFNNISGRFLKTGLFFLVISAIGPFCTAPLMAMGLKGTPLYFNAVHFYLHLQINGWFTCFLMAVMYSIAEIRSQVKHAKFVLRLIQTSIILTLLLSMEWDKPYIIANVIGGTGAVLQLAGIAFFIKDTKALKLPLPISGLLRIAFVFLILKGLMQTLNSFPAIAALSHQWRDLVIAYLHIMLVGFVTLMIFTFVLYSNPVFMKAFRYIRIFIACFIVLEILLFLRAAAAFMNYDILLLFVTMGMSAACFFIARSIRLADV